MDDFVDKAFKRVIGSNTVDLEPDLASMFRGRRTDRHHDRWPMRAKSVDPAISC